mmetsp:Transcript_19400/g.49144  ORF Transcript_19400/g.49144 Transcript_19400/m.49144 type:complete len:306 (-) Transcript_19400:1023-1940(-)
MRLPNCTGFSALPPGTRRPDLPALSLLLLGHNGIREVRHLLLGQVVDAGGDLVRSVPPALRRLEPAKATRKYNRRGLLPPMFAPQIRRHLIRHRRLEVESGNDAVLSGDFSDPGLLLRRRHRRWHSWAAAVAHHPPGRTGRPAVSRRCNSPSSPQPQRNLDLFPLSSRWSARAWSPDWQRDNDTPPATPPSQVLDGRGGPASRPHRVLSSWPVCLLLPEVHQPPPHVLNIRLGVCSHRGLSDLEHCHNCVAVCGVLARGPPVGSALGNHGCSGRCSFEHGRAAVDLVALHSRFSLAIAIAGCATR